MKLSKIKCLNNIGINDYKCSALNRMFLLFIFETGFHCVDLADLGLEM